VRTRAVPRRESDNHMSPISYRSVYVPIVYNYYTKMWIAWTQRQNLWQIYLYHAWIVLSSVADTDLCGGIRTFLVGSGPFWWDPDIFGGIWTFLVGSGPFWWDLDLCGWIRTFLVGSWSWLYEEKTIAFWRTQSGPSSLWKSDPDKIVQIRNHVLERYPIYISLFCKCCVSNLSRFTRISELIQDFYPYRTRIFFSVPNSDTYIGR
jgi:hypothetical protein